MPDKNAGAFSCQALADYPLPFISFAQFQPYTDKKNLNIAEVNEARCFLKDMSAGKMFSAMYHKGREPSLPHDGLDDIVIVCFARLVKHSKNRCVRRKGDCSLVWFPGTRVPQYNILRVSA